MANEPKASAIYEETFPGLESIENMINESEYIEQMDIEKQIKQAEKEKKRRI